MTTRASISAIAASLAAAAAAHAQSALGTSFTYQGSLQDNGNPANGTYDLQFRLLNDTAQVGNTICSDNVAVVDGLFTVTLDFGAQFNGEKRFIELGVRPGGAAGDCASGTYTTLTPLQPVTAAPYALSVPGIDGFSLNSANGSIGDALYVDNSGRVGIGTTSPGMTIQAARPTYYGGPGIGVDNGTTWAYLHGATQHSFIWNNTSDMRFGVETARGAGYSELMRITGAGNVGIGTAVPSAGLEINKGSTNDVGLQLTSSGAGWGSGIRFRNSAARTYGIYSGLDGKWQFVDQTLQAGRMTIDSAGNLGIGTTSPTTRLSVNGDANVVGSIGVGRTPGGFAIDASAATNALLRLTSPDPFGATAAIVSSSTGGSAWGLVSTGQTNPAGAGKLVFRDINFGADRLTIDGAGNVGIGTTTPTHLLTVNGNQYISGALELGPTAPLNNPHGFSSTIQINGRDFGASGSAAVVFTNSRFSVPLAWSAGVNTNGEFVFEYSGTPGFDIVNVPKLRIVGGSDVAEPFNVHGDEKPLPGMVVSIDPKNPGGMRISSGKYDRTVAGVISGAGGVNPGMMLTQKDTIADGDHPVALTGRVYCYVDADAGGAIQPGDLLTTSDTAGHAMKVNNYEAAQGAIIGKAMTSLESGKGLVLVLVNLQ